MEKLTVLYPGLINANSQHQDLNHLFETFANNIQAVFSEQSFQNFGAGYSEQFENQFFVLHYAGRAVYFEFSSIDNGDGVLMGKVNCFVKRDFPRSLISEIEFFGFNGVGISNIPSAEEETYLDLNDRSHCVHIAMHFLWLLLKSELKEY